MARPRRLKRGIGVHTVAGKRSGAQDIIHSSPRRVIGTPRRSSEGFVGKMTKTVTPVIQLIPAPSCQAPRVYIINDGRKPSLNVLAIYKARRPTQVDDATRNLNSTAFAHPQQLPSTVDEASVSTTKGRLDNIFSRRMFSFLGGGSQRGSAQERAEADAASWRATQQQAADEATKRASQQAQAIQEDAEEDAEEDEFCPFTFIRTLPPLEDVVEFPRNVLLPPKTRRAPRITLVLDLDETLVHSTLEDYLSATTTTDFAFPVYFNNQEHTVNVRRRPGLERFMQQVAKMFEVIVFTASQQVYAEQLLNILDPTRQLIRHRIFRDSCVCVDGNYLKDLTVLGRDLRHVIIVDNSPQAFGYQLDNGIPIESWFDDADDGELLELLCFLETLVDAEDVRPYIARQFGLRERIEMASEVQ